MPRFYVESGEIQKRVNSEDAAGAAEVFFEQTEGEFGELVAVSSQPFGCDDRQETFMLTQGILDGIAAKKFRVVGGVPDAEPEMAAAVPTELG